MDRQPNAPRQGIAEFVTSMLGCVVLLLVLWGFSRLLPGMFLRRNWGDASMAELLGHGSVLLSSLICAAGGWYVGEIAAILLLKRFIPRASLRAVFVRGGLLARWEARTFDAIFPENV